MTRLALATALLVWSSAGFAAKPSSLEFAVAAALGASAQFTSARVDLDQDSRPDAVVLVRDAQWCGSGGCVMLVFKGTPKGFALVSRSTITAPPIRVLPSSHHGWRDLIVRSHGTGDVVLRFDGASYPSNPSLQPAPTPQQLRSAVDILGSSPANSPEAPPGGAPQLDG